MKSEVSVPRIPSDLYWDSKVFHSAIITFKVRQKALSRNTVMSQDTGSPDHIAGAVRSRAQQRTDQFADVSVGGLGLVSELDATPSGATRS